MKNSQFISWIISGSKSFRSWLVSLGENIPECCQQLYPWENSRSTSATVCSYLAHFSARMCVCHWLWKDHTQLNPGDCKDLPRNDLLLKEKIQIRAKDFLLQHLPASRETSVWVDFSFLKIICKITQKSSAKTCVSVTGSLRVVSDHQTQVWWGGPESAREVFKPCDVIVKKPGHPVTS